ncbi:hypothetical protein KSP39_PZI011345 [Platanthera zijinensis]|uniref:HAT C-terminal dimerisation domain-containing protein n=1 Tax=Platanthera zijinensis TaxID=2320716 RepID=A0AAP0BIK7_9ASPA
MNGGEYLVLVLHNYKKLAIRILSQTSSSSGCERNWSVFEQIHTTRRNHLEHQRLNDLVYVCYNLNMRDRTYFKKRSYDPLDYTSIDSVDFWVVEEEPAPELNYNNLESEIYQEITIPIVGEVQDSNHQNEQTQGNLYKYKYAHIFVYLYVK